jgi:hypothetical protein
MSEASEETMKGATEPTKRSQSESTEDDEEMETGGDGDDADEEEEEEVDIDALVRDADEYLNSPNSRKKTKKKKLCKKPGVYRSASVPNSLENVPTKNITGVPYPGEQNYKQPARIQSAPESNTKEISTGMQSKTEKLYSAGTGTGTSTDSGIRKTSAKRSFSGSTSSVCGERGGRFPSVYSSVRKTREKTNPYRELPTIEGNRRKAATCSKPLHGFDISDDERQFKVVNYHIPSLKKNVSSSVRSRDGELFCVTCNQEHSFGSDEPFCVVITDQMFSPSLPTDEKRCVVIVRLEDCLLSEQPGLLKEFFGNRTGYLPEGSVLMFGSVSHLAARGLENYTEEVVKIFKVLNNMLARGCNVIHMVPVPLGGIKSANLIRDLYDLDCWLRNSVSNLQALTGSRECFWNIVSQENACTGKTGSGERILFLPESVDKSNRIRTVSGEITDSLPDTIDKISESGEKRLIQCIMTEIVENYAVDVDPYPSLERCSGDQAFADSASEASRLIVIGASHATRLVGGLAEYGQDVINLAKPGWSIDEDAVADISVKLKKLNPNDSDILIFDPVSNDTFCGTDKKGNHIDPVKMGGSWHVQGQLSIRPKSYIKNTLKMCDEIVNAAGNAKLILLLPLPRYIKGSCCPDPDHVTNLNSPDFVDDISGGLEMVEEVLHSWLQSLERPSTLLHYRSVIDVPDAPLTDLQLDGSPLWSMGDNVHCAPAVYEAIAQAIIGAVADLNEATEQPAKRQRMESVVVRSAREHNLPHERPVRPPGWSSGVLPDRPRRGRGAPSRRFFRGRPWPRGGRGFFRGGMRGGRGR